MSQDLVRPNFARARSHDDFESSHSRFLSMLPTPMAEDKKLGVTHSIREKLNFQDERLWKRFLARRLELIDTLDLSSKKASEQEDEIRKVAEILRLEFKFDIQYFEDFDKLVRAAVQSVRRNRKRSTKLKRNGTSKDRGSRPRALRMSNRKPPLLSRTDTTAIASSRKSLDSIQTQTTRYTT